MSPILSRFQSRLVRRACAAAGCAALAALQPLPAQDAVTRHFWTFEGDFQDQVGGAHATVTADTTVTLVAGRGGTGQAMATLASVGGDNDYAKIAAASALFVPGDGAFSFSGWFRMAADTGNNRGVFDFSGNGFDGPQMLLTATNSLNFRVDGLGAYNLVSMVPNAAVEDGVWHFFAAVYDPSLESGTLKFYLNGSSPAATASRGATAATWVAPHAASWLGTFNFTGSRESKGLDGELDDLAYYEGVLSETQIQALFENAISPLDLAPETQADGPPTLVSYHHDTTTGVSTIVWESLAGRSYRVWGASDLGSWENLTPTPLPGTGHHVQFQHAPDGTPPRYFYRIELLPTPGT